MNGLTPSDEGTLIQLRVVARSSRNALTVEDDGMIKVRLQAPAIEGKANKALLKFLAGRFGLPARSLALVSGERSRNKRLLVKGLTCRQVADSITQQTTTG